MKTENNDWLCRPIAHRAFHNADKGIVENSRTAVLEAMHRNYAIEVDLQASKENQPIVFHDWKLDRLTTHSGKVAQYQLETLRKIPHKLSPDTIMSLQDLLDLVEGKVPLIIEIKAETSADNLEEFGRNIGKILKNYKGQVAIMSFVPDIVRYCIQEAPHLPRGITYSPREVSLMRTLYHLIYGFFRKQKIKPQFIAYDVRAIPGIISFLIKNILGLKLLVWTVRTPKQRKLAQEHADAMIFEGFEV